MTVRSWEVLFEDNHLLVVNKPAGLPTMGVAEDEPSLWRECREYIRRKYHKPGNVYLGVVSRVDRLVTGVVIFARTSKAASRLAEQFREGVVDKTYWALVEQPPQPASGRCEDWVYKNEARQRMEVVESGRMPAAQMASLSYRTLARDGGETLVEVQLETGRKHQIRLQLGSRGWPILGDLKYGAARQLATGNRIALHARRLRLEHPVRREPLEIVAPLPAAWGPRWQAWVGAQE